MTFYVEYDDADKVLINLGSRRVFSKFMPLLPSGLVLSKGSFVRFNSGALIRAALIVNQRSLVIIAASVSA